MGVEIERARGLLSTLIRDKVMAAEEATKAYEAWVASGDEAPFCRFVIALFPERGEAIRHVLRQDAVRGMPRPEVYTYERFEDLLVGQLGIEAGMLSPKLLQTVRAVQDKKATENKLRRLEDLLPRAGVDAKMLGMLYNHLRERVLICKGCLGRFPRKEMGALAIECPRCDYNMLADALEPSDVKELPEEQRMALMASSEAVLETVSVADRQRTRTDRGGSRDKAATGVIFALTAVLGVIVLVIGVLVMRPGGGGAKVKTSKKTRVVKTDDGPTKTEDEDPEPKDGLSLAEVRAQDLDLYKRGEFKQLLELWEKVKPQSGESKDDVAAARDARTKRLGELIEMAKQVSDLALKLDDPAQEQALARLLGRQEVPVNVPPFEAAKAGLDKLRQTRRDQVTEAARARYEAVRAKASADAWARRRKDIAHAPALMGVALDGRRVDGVRVLDLDAEGFEVQTPTGAARRFTWDDEPELSLRVMQAGADAGQVSDQLEVLRRALIARNPKVAAEAMAKVPGSLSAATLISRAPTSVVPAPLGGDLYRVNYPMGWKPGDLEPDRGSQLESDGLRLTLSGNPCRVQSRPIPAIAPDPKNRESALFVEVELEDAAPGLSFALRLLGKGTEKSYVARWGNGQWSLDLSLGTATGRNTLKTGTLRSAGRTARLSYDGREVTLVLDGFPVFTKGTTARVTDVGFALGASEALKIRALRIEGTLDPAQLASAEQRFRERVHQEVDALAVSGGGAQGDFSFPELSAEDPQALAVLDPGPIEKLTALKKQLLAGEVDAAAAAAESLVREVPTYAAAQYYRAYVALLREDPCRALIALDRALDRDPGFIEARALRALALAKSLRIEAADADLDRALRARPDLAVLHLARARLALLKADLSLKPEGPIAGEAIRVAQGLGGADPLAVREGRALVTLEGLARSLNTRKLGEGHLVLSRGAVEQAEAVVLFLDHTVVKPFKAELGAKLPRGGTVRVALLPDRYGQIVGDKRAVAYVPGLDLIVMAEAIQEPTDDLLRALAEAHLAHRMGPAPAWLNEGMAEYLVRRLNRKYKNEAKLKLLDDNLRMTPDEWRALLTAERADLAKERLLRAQSWALVEGVLSTGQRMTIAKKASDAVPLTLDAQGLDLSKLEEPYRNWVRRQNQ
ncbi:MAG: hypothetical protein AB7N76_17635 [Planctomycetota bacterium]